MSDQKTIWILTGPTACGKTALSLAIARRFDAEIACMDSMQIYRDMDIGTAKPTAEERAVAPHHMLDIVDPSDTYSVAQWVEDASKVIRGIQRRGKQALLVGGTGFYLRALRQPMSMGMISGDEALRGELEQLDSETLHAMLAEVDPETAARLHVNDRRRVIRALEVCRLTGVPFSRQPQSPSPAPFPSRCVVLNMPRESLYQRVNQRVDQMMADGLPDEVSMLLQRGLTANHQSMKAIGYKELIPCITDGFPLESAVDAIKQASRHYAKRQLTWFRRETDTAWIQADQPDALENTIKVFTEEPS